MHGASFSAPAESICTRITTLLRELTWVRVKVRGEAPHSWTFQITDDDFCKYQNWFE